MNFYFGRKRIISGNLLLDVIVLNIIFVLSSFHSIKLLKGLQYGVAALILLICGKWLFQNNKLFIKRWYVFFLIYAIASAFLLQLILFNQNFILSGHAWISRCGGWTLFLYFLYKKRNIDHIEKVLFLTEIAHLAFFIFAYLFYRDTTRDTELAEGLYSQRFMFGSYILTITFFFLLVNRYMITAKLKYIYMLGIPGSMILVQQTRQIFLIMTFILAIYLFKRLSRKVFALILIGALVAGRFVAPVIEHLITKTEQQRAELGGDDSNYVRVQEYKYYFNDFNETDFQNVFGNGIPQAGSPMFDSKTFRLGLVADVGYAGTFMYWGWVGLIAFALLFFKISRVKLPEDKKWMWMAFLNIYLLNIGSFAFRSGELAIILYCYVEFTKQNKINQIQSKRI